MSQMSQNAETLLDDMKEYKKTFTFQESEVLETLEEMITSSSKVIEFLKNYKKIQNTVFQELSSLQDFNPLSRIDGDHWRMFWENFIYSIETASSAKNNCESILMRMDIVRQKLIDLKQNCCLRDQTLKVSSSSEHKILEIQTFSHVNTENINHLVEVFKNEIISLCMHFITTQFDSKFEECHKLQGLRFKFQSLLKGMKSKEKSTIYPNISFQSLLHVTPNSGSFRSRESRCQSFESEILLSPSSQKSNSKKPLPVKPLVKSQIQKNPEIPSVKNDLQGSKIVRTSTLGRISKIFSKENSSSESKKMVLPQPPMKPKRENSLRNSSNKTIENDNPQKTQIICAREFGEIVKDVLEKTSISSNERKDELQQEKNIAPVFFNKFPGMRIPHIQSNISNDETDPIFFSASSKGHSERCDSPNSVFGNLLVEEEDVNDGPVFTKSRGNSILQSKSENSATESGVLPRNIVVSEIKNHFEKKGSRKYSMYISKFEFIGTIEGQLTILPGDLLLLNESSIDQTGWVYVINHKDKSKFGFVPHSYIKRIDDKS